MQLFLKDCITYCSELYMQSFSVIDFYKIAYDAFLPKKENKSSGKTMSNWQQTEVG